MKARVLAVVLVLASSAACADLTTLPDYSARRLGKTAEVDLASFKGKALMINTWATWCAPCRAELPGLEGLYQRYKPRGLVVIAVSIDEGRADTMVAEFVDRLGLTFPILRDPANRFAKAFRTLGVPETLLFDRAGKLIKHWRGRFKTGSAATYALIEAALASPAERTKETGEAQAAAESTHPDSAVRARRHAHPAGTRP